MLYLHFFIFQPSTPLLFAHAVFPPPSGPRSLAPLVRMGTPASPPPDAAFPVRTTSENNTFFQTPLRPSPNAASLTFQHCKKTYLLSATLTAQHHVQYKRREPLSMHFCTVRPPGNAKKHNFRLHAPFRLRQGHAKSLRSLHDTGPEAPEKRLSGADEEGMPRIRRLSAWRSTVS